MRTAIAMGSSALALTAAACAPPAKPLAAALNCPATQGALTRASAAADGQSCLYHGVGGTEVLLRRVPVTGGTDATLGVIERDLRADTSGDFVKAEVQAGAEIAAADAARTAAEAAADAKASDTPADDAGRHERADVHLPGIHIRAQGEDADVQVGPIKIRANEGDGVVIRLQRDVRLKGEAMSRERRGVRATLILAREHGFGGYKVLGYEAGGPKTGPLTVATIKAREGDSDHLYDDMKRLVRRNSGV